MRIATWNVNSLKARLEKVTWWLDRAKPDVLMMQETKLADAEAPTAAFRQAGYALVHHGEGRWNGVAIASRRGIDAVITNFGEPLRPAHTSDTGDDEPLADARMISAQRRAITRRNPHVGGAAPPRAHLRYRRRRAARRGTDDLGRVRRRARCLRVCAERPGRWLVILRSQARVARSAPPASYW